MSDLDTSVKLPPRGTGIEVPHWIGQALSLDRDGQIASAIDVIYEQFDQLLIDGKLADVDSILRQIPIVNTSLTFLMSVLSITLPASRALPSREGFYRQVCEAAIAQGRDPEKLLGGLRHWSRIHGSGSSCRE